MSGDPFSNGGGFAMGSSNASPGYYRPSGSAGPHAMRQPTPPQVFHVKTSSQQQQDTFAGGGGIPDGFYSAQQPQQQPFFGSSTDMRSSSQDLMGCSINGSTGSQAELHRSRFGFPEDDLPLLEELGIFPRHIQAKALAVLNPFSPNTPDAIEDMDLAGPVMFAVMLAFLLSLQGKVQFSAIYGLSLLGIAFAKMLLTLMCDQHSVSVQFVVSTLGYCLLPNLVLATIQTFQYWLVGSHTVILPVAFVVIAWSAWCATTMFVQALSMELQKFLILYPCVLFYAVFAALTIF